MLCTLDCSKHLTMKHISFLLLILLPVLHEVAAVNLQINNKVGSYVEPLNTTGVFSLKCEAHNRTEGESLTWYRGSQILNVKDENSINTSDVCINPVSPSDNGVSFTCLLKRDSAIKVTVTLNVVFPPMLSGETEIIVEEGKNAKLTCNYQANPRPEMTWRQNNSFVNMVKSRYEQYLNSDTFELSINKVVADDAGIYTCIAASTMDIKTRDFHLVVEPRKEPIPVEAIAAAVVVGVLTILFGLFARREKIFKKCMKSRDNTSL